MAMQMAVFAFGSLLMLVAILGGGFELKELKVPKVGRNSRWAACGCGLMFIFLGIYLDRPAAAAPAAPAPPAEKAATVAALPPQIVLISGMASQPVLQPAPPALPPLPALPQQLGADVRESRPAAQQAAAQATSEPQGQAAASSRTASKRVPWEQKPRQWIYRLKGKE